MALVWNFLFLICHLCCIFLKLLLLEHLILFFRNDDYFMDPLVEYEELDTVVRVFVVKIYFYFTKLKV
jgi:hypothetical protein